MNSIDKIREELQFLQKIIPFDRAKRERLLDPNLYQITLKPIKSGVLENIMLFLPGKKKKDSSAFLNRMNQIAEKALENHSHPAEIWWCIGKRQRKRLQRVYFYEKQKN